MLMWLTMLVLFACILFFAAASYLALAMVMVPAWAAFITGVGLLVVFALLAGLTYALLTHAATKTSPQEQKQANTQTQPAGERQAANDDSIDVRAGAQWMEKNYDVAIAGTLAAGVALAASPGLRRLAIRTAAPVVTRLAGRALRKYVGR